MPDEDFLNFSMRAGNILIVLGIIASWVEHRVGDVVLDTFGDKTDISASPNSKQNAWFFVGITISILGAILAGFGDSLASSLAVVFACGH